MATALGLALCVIAADVASAASRPPQDSPEGFAAGTTGGRGGRVVRVTTAEQLKHELCRSVGAGGVCSDDEPRIVEVAGTFDYTGSEATTSGLGCDVGNACVAPYKTESLVLLNGDDKHCDGLPTRQIVFDKAGNNPLLVGSNKSVIGVGAHATIKGKGLVLKGVRNVAIRNLTISDINPGIVFAGDAVTLNDADHVWIDHNRFRNIGRQMIVGGFKPTTHLTISWNDFDGHSVYSHYCNGTHYWNLLLAGSEQSITLSHNWFREFSGRAPKIDGQSAVIHLVNNYFQNGSWHALDAVEPVKVLVEGNYFDHVAVPITVSSHPGYVFGSQGEPDAAARASCQTALRRNCAGNIAMPAPSVNGFALQGQVMNAFAAVPKSEIAVPNAPSGVPATVRENAGPGHF